MSHPEPYTLEDLRSWNAAGAPIQLAVLGDPVAHSASPAMHMAALGAWGLPHVYGKLHLRPEELAEALPLLAAAGFLGVNLTIPHKTSVLALLDEIDPRARFLGAVNTVAFREGKSIGYNTDGPGLERAVEESFGITLAKQRIVVLGAGGGAGRAIALHCALQGCRSITLVNRSLDKAEALVAEIGTLPAPPDSSALPPDSPALAEHVAAADLILQCSSVGMQQNDPSALDPSLLAARHLIYETIYSNRTQLVANAEALGARTANGLSMLLHQGALAFEIWFERPAPLEKMRSALLAAVSRPKS